MVHKTNFEKDLVYLYQFPPCVELPNLSPFCLKLESWLRLAEIKYETVPVVMKRSKEGTLPFIELNGVEYDDSGFIIDELTQRFSKQSLEGDLSTEQRAIGRLVEQTCENSLILTTLYAKFVDNIDLMLDESVTGFAIPSAMKVFKPFFRRKYKKRVVAHGIGKHAPEKIYDIGAKDIQALSDILGTKPFLFGEKPHKADMCAFGNLANLVFLNIKTKQLEYLEQHCPNLVGYCERVKSLLWPDWKEKCHQAK